jgi:hypothetical protein
MKTKAIPSSDRPAIELQSTARTDGNGHSEPIGDLFDNIESLRAGTDYGSQVPVTKKWTTIAVTKRPKKGRFFRIHPDTAFSIPVNLVVMDRDETFMVAPCMRESLSADDTFCRAMLYVGIYRPDNKPFVWWVRLGDPGSRENDWWISAHAAANDARTQWVRLVTELDAGCYSHEIAQADWRPEFPQLEFKEILKLAFGKALIDRPDHPAVLALQGRE